MSNKVKQELREKLLNSILSQLIKMCKLSTDYKAPGTTFYKIKTEFKAGVLFGLVEKADFDVVFDLARLTVFGETNAGRKKRLTYERITQKKEEIAQLEASLR